MSKKYLNIIFIVIILAILFLSQQPFFRERGEYVQLKIGNFWEDLKPKREVFFNNMKGFFQEQILARITGEVEKRKEIVQEELESRKEEVEEKIEEKEEEIKDSIWQKVKDFFLGKFKPSK